MKYLQTVVLLCPRNLLSMVHSKARFNLSWYFPDSPQQISPTSRRSHSCCFHAARVERAGAPVSCFALTLFRCHWQAKVVFFWSLSHLCVSPRARTTRPVGDSEAVARWHPPDPEGLSSPGGPVDCCGSQDGLSRNHHARLAEMLCLFVCFFKHYLSNLS